MIIHKLLRLTISVLILSFCLSGCSGYVWIPAHPDDPEYAPTAPPEPSAVPNLTGSIYQTNYGLDSLYNDLRAYKVGDILTVNLIETTTAQKAANTNTTKTSNVDVSDPTIFGSMPQFNVPKIIPLVSNKDNNLRFKLDSNNTFTGNGASSQNNALQGSITVTVERVLANGNLIIKGEKWITLNQGSEYIRLNGIVRPYDIDANNTVPSTKLANPRITYRGTGALAEANQAGWLARFFNGPVYPY